MPLKQKLYSISETEKLLSLTAKDLGVLVKDGELRSERMITAESIEDYAKRKQVEIGTEAAS